MDKDYTKIKVFCAIPGAGKSWLAEKDDRFVDIDMMEAKYKYGLSDDIDRDTFTREFQGRHKQIVNKDFMRWIHKKIYSILNDGKIVLSATHKHVLKFLEKNKIPFAFVDYNPKYIEIYRRRMRERGNSEEFINRMMFKREEAYNQHKNSKVAYGMLEIDGDKYMSDVMWKIFGKPQNDI